MRKGVFDARCYGKANHIKTQRLLLTLAVSASSITLTHTVSVRVWRQRTIIGVCGGNQKWGVRIGIIFQLLKCFEGEEREKAVRRKEMQAIEEVYIFIQQLFYFLFLLVRNAYCQIDKATTLGCYNCSVKEYTPLFRWNVHVKSFKLLIMTCQSPLPSMWSCLPRFEGPCFPFNSSNMW